MIDVLYVSYNRLEFTRESFTALVENTEWDMVEKLYVHDDGSTDGTIDFLHEAAQRVPDRVEVVIEYDAPKGPVHATNWYLDHAALDGREQGDMFAKIDNDFVVCPGWLGELHRIMHIHAGLDILGMEPMGGNPVAAGESVHVPGHSDGRHFREASHIGGKGLIRLRAFEMCRPTPRGFNGYYGFTEWQRLHPSIVKAWIDPELPVFGLDQLPLEPWRSLAATYAEKGWARRWPEYESDATAYWDWWTPRFSVSAS